MRDTDSGRRVPAVGRTFAAAVLTLAACASPTNGGGSGGDRSARVTPDGSAAVPTTTPDIRGTITRIQPGDSVRATGAAADPSRPVSCPPDCAPTGRPLRAVLIEETPGPLASGGPKSQVTVTATAHLLRRTGAGVVAIGFDELREGQRVEAWFTGPVAESYPSRATAGTIVVTAP